jgi:hypothetical protein
MKSDMPFFDSFGQFPSQMKNAETEMLSSGEL